MVTLGPEDGRAEVVEHVGGHAAEVDPQIHRGQPDHLRRGGGPHQQLAGQDRPRGHQDHAADEGEGHGGVYALSHVLLPSGPQIPGHHHVGTHGEADKEVDQEVDKGAVGAHGSQGLLARVASHHHHVRRVEEQLEQAGEHQGQGEEQQLPRQGTVDHVDAVARLLHRLTGFRVRGTAFLHHKSHLVFLKNLYSFKVIPYPPGKNNPEIRKNRPKSPPFFPFLLEPLLPQKIFATPLTNR